MKQFSDKALQILEMCNAGNCEFRLSRWAERHFIGENWRTSFQFDADGARITADGVGATPEAAILNGYEKIEAILVSESGKKFFRPEIEQNRPAVLTRF